MKKHLFLFLLSLSLILCFSACENSKKNATEGKAALTENSTSKATKSETSTTTKTTAAGSTTPSSIAAETEPEHPVTETIDLQVIDRTDSKVQEALAAYKAVLLDNAEFFYGVQKISSFNQILDKWDSNPEFSLKQFAIIDLDRDGLPEVILPYSSTSYPDGYFILHYTEKEQLVYAYSPSIREFCGPKIDGTYTGGSSETSICKITSFDGATYSEDKILTFYFYLPPDGYTMYWIDSKSVTIDEYHDALDEQLNKLDLTWYDSTAENIDTYFSIK